MKILDNKAIIEIEILCEMYQNKAKRIVESSKIDFGINMSTILYRNNFEKPIIINVEYQNNYLKFIKTIINCDYQYFSDFYLLN